MLEKAEYIDEKVLRLPQLRELIVSYPHSIHRFPSNLERQFDPTRKHECLGSPVEQRNSSLSITNKEDLFIRLIV
ncbi:hypothetical protein DNHGIG_32830 [Collibacillus ludicampi]|uniref:Uncharacterized protein n=1 Tax=Collibacillus ludicampi TaxID=2771369 RepID=A0AAV4LIW9_9BACL|nr:hypothetical protein DNHGIG_32830 [Collibacillus ludicampi]